MKRTIIREEDKAKSPGDADPEKGATLDDIESEEQGHVDEDVKTVLETRDTQVNENAVYDDTDDTTIAQPTTSSTSAHGH